MAEEQREQNQGFFSKVIDGANSGYNKYRGGRMAVNVGKQVGKKALTGAAEATSEFWIPAVIFGLAVVVILFVLFEGAPTVIGGDLSNNPSPSPTESSSPGPTASSEPTTRPGDPVNASNVVAKLKDDFNIIVNDTNSDHLITTYNILALAGKSSAYESLLKKAGPTQIYFDNSPCGGGVNWAGNITLHSFFSGCGQPTRQYILIHETGHVIAIYSGRLWGSFYNSAYYPSDGSCYAYHGADGYYLRTYPYSAANGGGGGRSESFAESVSLYVLPRGVLSSYKTQCPAGYSWEKTNIFGGYEF